MSLKRRGILEDLKKLITSAEEVLELKEDLESSIVERGKGSGLRPTSVVEARKKLKEKKTEHKLLLENIIGKYEQFWTEFIPPPPYTPQDLQCEPEHEPGLGPQQTRPKKSKRNRITCCGMPHRGSSSKMNKNKQTKKRKKKKQSRRYKRLR
tara:strand:+ start:2279 stop:2734 length:456 start_codon:yes stop_codon:yes gene_type:complete